MYTREKLEQLYECVKSIGTEYRVSHSFINAARHGDLEAEVYKRMCHDIAKELATVVDMTTTDDDPRRRWLTYRGELLVLSKKELLTIAGLIKDGEEWGLTLA